MFVVLVFSLLLLSTVLDCSTNDKCYSRKYDYFNADQLVNNPRLLKKYLDCFLDQGPCTPIGWVFKRVLPEVIRTACAKCTPPQKEFTKMSIDAFKISLPEEHAALKRKYDPKNKYYDAFEEAIAK